MIEPSMFFGLGFLTAGLIALVIVPLIHARAVRLTRRRLEASSPLSMAEIQADKDQLRAEFAIAIRRLEMSVEQLKAKSTAQLAELGKKTATINALKAELAEKTAATSTVEAREKGLQDQLHSTEEALGAKVVALGEAERKLAEKDAEFGKLRADLEQRSMTTDSQRIEIVALKTQLATLGDRAADLQQELKQAEERANQERRKAEQAESERGKLQYELSTLKREAETWEAERGDNALLRERINEVAAEIAQLTAAVEGGASPVKLILAGAALSSGAASSTSGAPSNGISLADRIRALQDHSRRKEPAN